MRVNCQWCNKETHIIVFKWRWFVFWTFFTGIGGIIYAVDRMVKTKTCVKCRKVIK